MPDAFATTELNDLISSWPASYVFTLILVMGIVTVLALMVVLIVGISVIAIQIRKIREAYLDVWLKRTALEQGMSSEDVERIVAAKRDG